MADVDVPRLADLFCVLGVAKKDATDPKKRSAECVFRWPLLRRSKEDGATGAIRDRLVESVIPFAFVDLQLLTWKQRLTSRTFIFVMTRGNGQRLFGVCRRFLPPGSEPRLPQVAVFLSSLNLPGLFSALLDIIETAIKQGHDLHDENGVVALLEAVLDAAQPEEDDYVYVPLPAGLQRNNGVDVLRFHNTAAQRLDNTRSNLHHLVAFLDVPKLLALFAALLSEQRIILTSRSVSRVSFSVQAIQALLYPFSWQHVFVPLLPHIMLHVACAPMPFVIGVHSSALPELDKLPLEDVVFVDLDNDLIVIDRRIVSTLPKGPAAQLAISLRRVLKLARAGGDPTAVNEPAVAMCFTAFFASLFMHYRFYLRKPDAAGDNGGLPFRTEEFLAAQETVTARKFLAGFVESQMFERFVAERVDHPHDDFDDAIVELIERDATSPGARRMAEFQARAAERLEAAKVAVTMAGKKVGSAAAEVGANIKRRYAERKRQQQQASGDIGSGSGSPATGGSRQRRSRSSSGGSGSGGRRGGVGVSRAPGVHVTPAPRRDSNAVFPGAVTLVPEAPTRSGKRSTNLSRAFAAMSTVPAAVGDGDEDAPPPPGLSWKGFASPRKPDAGKDSGAAAREAPSNEYAAARESLSLTQRIASQRAGDDEFLAALRTQFAPEQDAAGGGAGGRGSDDAGGASSSAGRGARRPTIPEWDKDDVAPVKTRVGRSSSEEGDG